MMFRMMLVCVAATAVAGCDPGDQRPAPVSKVIVDKLHATEQRMSWDPFDKQAVRGRATEVYYLVAEDGSTLEVDMKLYVKAKKGESYESRKWKD